MIKRYHKFYIKTSSISEMKKRYSSVHKVEEFDLLVGTPTAFGPELEFRMRIAQPSLIGVHVYFWYTIILLLCLCTTFLWPLCFGWLLVLSLHKEDYLQIFKCVSFW